MLRSPVIQKTFQTKIATSIVASVIFFVVLRTPQHRFSLVCVPVAVCVAAWCTCHECPKVRSTGSLGLAGGVEKVQSGAQTRTEATIPDRDWRSNVSHVRWAQHDGPEP